MIPLDILRDVLANVANPGPWSVADHHNYRHVVNADGNIIADDVGDDAPLIAAAPDLARDVLTLADALATAEASVAQLRADLERADHERQRVESERDAMEEERDTARSALDGLVAAVRSIGDLIAEHGCSCDCGCAHTTGEHTSACDPCLACRASSVVSPLLSAAPAPTTVPAPLVRAYLRADARSATGTHADAAALAAARTALDAALARCP